jgi:hypothetical protein
MVDIVKELAGNKTILQYIPSAKYSKVLTTNAKKLAKKNVCYVTISKTFASLDTDFKKKGVNVKNMIFIDAISKTIIEKPDQTDRCYYVTSPSALTELSLVISKFLRHEFDYIVFDSLSNLMVYHKKGPLLKFVNNLINKVKGSKTQAIFYAVSGGETSDLIKQCETFVDKAITA